MRVRTLFVAGLLPLAVAATAYAQPITLDKPSCIPEEQNAVVRATANGVAAGQSLRLYFRWKDHEDFYWVAMEAEPSGRFWAVPPKPEKRNEQVEMYSALVDANGKVLSRTESQVVKVTKECNVQLNEKELGVAQNLTVGETSPKQEGKKVMAFLCDGVVTRINSKGIRRADGVCRACVIAWWMHPATAGALIGTGIVISDPGDDPEPSPARP